MEEDHSWKKPVFNLPREVFLPHHVAGNGRVPGRGDLGWRVHWLGFHSPHVVVADVVVHHGGEGWREGQASRGKERMITTPVQQQDCTKHNCIKLVDQILLLLNDSFITTPKHWFIMIIFTWILEQENSTLLQCGYDFCVSVWTKVGTQWNKLVDMHEQIRILKVDLLSCFLAPYIYYWTLTRLTLPDSQLKIIPLLSIFY